LCIQSSKYKEQKVVVEVNKVLRKVVGKVRRCSSCLMRRDQNSCVTSVEEKAGGEGILSRFGKS